MPRGRKGKGRETSGLDTTGAEGSTGPGASKNLRAQAFLEKEGIRDELEEAVINKEENLERFISHKSLKQIWTARLIPFFQILEPGYDNSAIIFAEKNLIKTLSILVAIGWPHWSSFWDLFFTSKDSSGRLNHLDNSLPYAFLILKDVSFLGKWAPAFQRMQHIFIPIVVESGQIQEYEKEYRLPFIDLERKDIGEGGFGKVTKEVIACHQFRQSNLVNENDYPVARKSFTLRGNFRKEMKNLKTLHSSLSGHDRIVSYLAVITVGNEFNILSPLANFDLEKFLYEDQAIFPNPTITTLLRESANVSGAIHFLHNNLQISGQSLFCCHMDLKPDNILVYSDPQCPVGKWKISDFGISALNEDKSEHGSSRTSSGRLNVPGVKDLVRSITTVKVTPKRGPGIYQAPEAQASSGRIGRSSDIWSFGCILSEVLARGIGGTKLVNELAEQRGMNPDNAGKYKHDYFCRESSNERILNPHVRNWLHSDVLGCSDAERTSSRQCQALILEMLRIRYDERPNASEVWKRLSSISHGSANTRASDPRRPDYRAPQTQYPVSLIDEDLYSAESPQSIHTLGREGSSGNPRGWVESSQPDGVSSNQRGGSDSRPDARTSARPEPRHQPTEHSPIPQINLPVAVGSPSLEGVSIEQRGRDQPIYQESQARNTEEDGFTRPPNLFDRNSAPNMAPSSHVPKEPRFGSPASSHVQQPIQQDAYSAQNFRAPEDSATQATTTNSREQYHNLSGPPQLPRAMKTPTTVLPFRASELLRKSDTYSEWRNYQQASPQQPQKPILREPISSYPPGGRTMNNTPLRTSPNPVINGTDPHRANISLDPVIHSPPPYSPPNMITTYVPTRPSPNPITANGSSHLQNRQTPRSSLSSVSQGTPNSSGSGSRTSSISHGENVTYAIPNGTSLSILSPDSEKIAFLGANRVFIYAMDVPQSSLTITAPEKSKWLPKTATLAGDYFSIFAEQNRDQSFYLYRLSTLAGQVTIQESQFDPKCPYDQIVVSQHGRQLCRNQSGVLLLQAGNQQPVVLQPRGHIREVWFSTDGLWAIAWSFKENNQYIDAWNVLNIRQRFEGIYRIPWEEHYDYPIVNIVAFPDTPACIIWRRHNDIHIIKASPPAPPGAFSPQLPSINLPNLQALVVLPKRHLADEVIIWIKGETSWPMLGGTQVSVNVAKLQIISGQLQWRHGTSVVMLDHKLKEPRKCSLTVAETGDVGTIRVIVAHDGKVEKKCINIIA